MNIQDFDSYKLEDLILNYPDNIYDLLNLEKRNLLFSLDDMFCNYEEYEQVFKILADKFKININHQDILDSLLLCSCYTGVILNIIINKNT